MTGTSRLEQCVQVGLFVLFLALPALDSALDLDPSPPPANESIAERPTAPERLADLKAWRDRFEDYLNNTFGWRSWLVRRFHRLNYRLFRVSENSSVHVGRDGWLFYGDGDRLSAGRRSVYRS